MRWADFGPTPGRQRSASISSSRAEGDIAARRGSRAGAGAAASPRPETPEPAVESQNGSFMPGGSCRPAVKPPILSWRRRLDAAHGVVHGRGHQVFQHLLVVHHRRIDADALHVVLAGHEHLDHAGAGLALDLGLGQFFLHLLHVLLHLLGLLHEASQGILHHNVVLAPQTGLIVDSLMVASNMSIMSRTKPSCSRAATASFCRSCCSERDALGRRFAVRFGRARSPA